MNPSQLMDFDDLEPKWMNVSYRGKKYILREADSGAVALYRNIKTGSMRGFDSEGRPLRFEGISEAEPALVGACLFEVKDGKDSEKPIGTDAVKKWLNKPIAKMFEWVKDNSDLDPPDTEEVLIKAVELAQRRLNDHRTKKQEESLKNVQAGTTGTSA